MQQIITVVYRQLATKHHPDYGGRTSDMQDLNAAIEGSRTRVYL